MSCACHPNAPVCPQGRTILRVTTKAELLQCFDIRRQVFIAEQGIPEDEEWDDQDLVADHLLAISDGTAMGTARTYRDGDAARIGRIAVLPDGRGRGLGAALVEAALDLARAQGARVAVLDAQLHAIAFYERLGFVAEGPEFDDGSGILHRRMTRTTGPAARP